MARRLQWWGLAGLAAGPVLGVWVPAIGGLVMGAGLVAFVAGRIAAA